MGFNVSDQSKTLLQLQREVIAWAQTKGWFAEDVPFPQAIALLHSEVSEALEAWRDRGLERFTTTEGKPDDVGSEFADVLIRLLHYARYFDIDLVNEFDRKMTYNRTREYRHGGKRI